MTDKQLTILAAKAAGIGHPGGDHSRYDDGRLWDCKELRWWNPLYDDGDALRLAVILCIEIYPDKEFAETSTAFVVGGVGKNTIESWGPMRDGSADDPYAATRRAIVRAAAIVAQEREEGNDESC